MMLYTFSWRIFHLVLNLGRSYERPTRIPVYDVFGNILTQCPICEGPNHLRSFSNDFILFTQLHLVHLSPQNSNQVLSRPRRWCMWPAMNVFFHFYQSVFALGHNPWESTCIQESHEISPMTLSANRKPPEMMCNYLHTSSEVQSSLKQFPKLERRW